MTEPGVSSVHDTSRDLYQVIAEAVRRHPQADEYGHHVDECSGCGWPHCQSDYADDYGTHLGRVIGDLLIDLAGTGELLRSIDWIARA